MPFKTLKFMIKGKIPAFNINAEKRYINPILTKGIHTHNYINDSHKFLSIEFNELSNCFLREKRALIFETPNRVKIQHEYDVKHSKSLKANKSYYLINPDERLDWLKIYYDSERISIDDAENIKKEILKKLSPEILNLQTIHPTEDIKAMIWKEKKGFPCFILFPQKPASSFMLSMEFYQTIEIDNRNRCWLNRILYLLLNIINPLSKIQLSYTYFPLSKKTSWLYIRAPKNFEIKLIDTTNNINSKFRSRTHSDPEVKSESFTDSIPHNYIIEIDIAKSLKVWYYCIYYASLILTIITLLCGINILWFKAGLDPKFNLNGIDYYLKKDLLITLVGVVATGLITTRSFLITEETIVKRFSINVSIMVIINIIMSLIMILK